MLEKLVIKNVALIERAEIEFGKGLNVLSGETGSGKSVILDSINFVLGAKADKSMIRYGETECSVTAVFSPQKNNPVFKALEDADIETDEEIIVFRKLTLDGRGGIKVNGCPVNATMLRKITANLVDVHGQSEHFYLLSEINQLALLDKAAGNKLDDPKEKLSVLISEKKDIKQKLTKLGGNEAERGRRLDILKFQIDEIQEAELTVGEEEDLAAQRLFYANIEKIMRALSEASDLMNNENGAADHLRGASRSVSEIENLNPEYQLLSERLDSFVLEAEDIAATLADLAENVTFDESKANEAEERFDLIRSLKKKYGKDIPTVLQFCDNAVQEYDMLLNCDAEYNRLSHLLSKTNSEIYSVCKNISTVRKNTAESFCKRVSDELKTLNIKNANFCAEFDDYSEQDVDGVTLDGLDRMRFMFSANAGEPLKPLNKVISGGEMSRLMLAIKTKISDLDWIPTYIFDEIDTGISGNTARIVAEKFADIAAQGQIIAVSHLPQITAMADWNFLISKHETDKKKTVTNIRKLQQNDKIDEVIRLLGGDVESAAANSLAKELMNECSEYKNQKN